MRRQHLADFVNRFNQSVGEFFIFKMVAHSIDNTPPEFFAAFFVNRLIANYSEFVRSRRHENEHRIALPRLVHFQSMEFLLRNQQRIGLEFAALNKNANFPGRSGFNFTNRGNDPVVLELAQKFFCSHFTSPIPHLLRRNFRLLLRTR